MSSHNLNHNLQKHVLFQIAILLFAAIVAKGQEQESEKSEKKSSPVAATIGAVTAADGNEYFNATIVGGGPVDSNVSQLFASASAKLGWSIVGKVEEKHGDAKSRGDSVHLTLSIHHGDEKGKKPVLTSDVVFKPSEQIPKQGEYKKSGPGGAKGDWATINLSKVAKPVKGEPYEILSIRGIFQILDGKDEADPQIGLYFLLINGRYKKR